MPRRIHPFLVPFIVLAGVASVGIAAGTSPDWQKPAPQLVATPCNPIVSIDGKENFDAYCVVCHGKDAKGHGPAASAMKALVPDLTTMARRSGGKFDGAATLYIVKGTGKTGTPVHGVEDMPKAAIRINNLVAYLESIQQR
jgi:mono/diheme cytochrome c family protein